MVNCLLSAIRVKLCVSDPFLSFFHVNFTHYEHTITVYVDVGASEPQTIIEVAVTITVSNLDIRIIMAEENASSFWFVVHAEFAKVSLMSKIERSAR
jgi:hypothetical protein